MIPSIVNTTPPCYTVMDNFSQHKKDGDTWCSTPFYSGPKGYKMHLQVDANGDGSGAGTHVSVFVQIIKGEYDDTLTWPYAGTITYEIINWKEDSNHVKYTSGFSEELLDVVTNQQERITTMDGVTLRPYLTINYMAVTVNDILCIRVCSIAV